MAHTPLPWMVDRNHIYPASKPNVSLAHTSTMFTTDEAKANANLIVTAVNSHHELLEVCEKALEYAYSDERYDLAQSLEAAIAKAKNQ